MRFYLILSAVVALLFSANPICHSEPMQTGSVAPNWVLADTEGQPVSLYQQAESGNTTVMVFYASWCRKCKDLLPHLNELKQKLANEPYRFYLLNVWEDPDPEAIKQMQPTDIPVLIRAENVARRFAVESTPGVVIVGPDKKVLYRRVNGSSVDDTVAAMETLFDLE